MLKVTTNCYIYFCPQADIAPLVSCSIAATVDHFTLGSVGT